MSLGCYAGGRPLVLVRLPFMSLLSSVVIALGRPSNLARFLLCYAVKERPELDSQFKERVHEAIKYAKTIEDFDELIDPRTLACHYLGPKPSLYVLQVIDREQRKCK